MPPGVLVYTKPMAEKSFYGINLPLESADFTVFRGEIKFTRNTIYIASELFAPE